MKPKHRVMCPDCGRSKMLFETESKARNFIKWNGDDIDTNGGELRTYYCPACGGYHISSKPYKKTYDYNTENLIRRYQIDKAASKSINGIQLPDFEIEKIVLEIVSIYDSSRLSRKSLKRTINEFIQNNNKNLNKYTTDAIKCKAYKYYGI